MKYIYISIYRHSDKKSLLDIVNPMASNELKDQSILDFQNISKQFRKSALYEGMREMNDDYYDDGYQLSEEIGGKPSWYSTCD
jgi:hypothetical protein